MRRFPHLPFLVSAFLTAGVTAVIWHHRGQSLTVSSSQHRTGAPAAPLAAVTEVPAAFRDGIDSKTEMPLLDTLDAESCAAIVRSLPWEDAVGLLLDRWLELDSPACLECLFDLPPGPQREGWARHILGSWAEANPAAAQQYFIYRTGHRPRDVMSGSPALREQWGDFASLLLEGDCRKPREIIASMRAVRADNLSEADRNSQLSTLGREWETAVEKGLSGGEAAELLESITDTPGDPLKEWAENMKPSLQQTLSRRAPLTAMAWLKKHPHSAWEYELLDGTLYELLNGVAQVRSPEDTSSLIEPWPEAEEIAAWFADIPRLGEKRASIEVLIEAWTRLDVNAAGAWLNKQPDNAATDAGRAVMAEAAVKEDPRAALAWAQRITDETRRQKSIESVLKLWRSFDPVEAAAYASGTAGD